MYINLGLLKNKELTLQQLVLLQVVHQNKTEDMSEVLQTYSEDLRELDKKEYLTEIAGSKQNRFKKIRLSKLGKKVLDDISTPLVTEDTLKIFEWLKNIYLTSNKEIGNEKKTKILIAQFSFESGIIRNHLAYLIQCFINDEKEMEFSKRLQYLFFKGESVFNVKFDLHSSRLYQYYLKSQDYFEVEFKKIKN